MAGAPVRVYSTPDPTEGQLLKGLLESEGIAVLLKGEVDGPYRFGPVYLWVSAEDETPAKAVIDAVRSGAYAEALDDESVDSGS